MELTTELVNPYLQGRFVSRDELNSPEYSGSITSITFINGQLEIVIAQTLVGLKLANRAVRWVRDTTYPTHHTITLSNYTLKNIGKGEKGGDRILLQSKSCDRAIILHPHDGVQVAEWSPKTAIPQHA